ncbi:MAG TPA: glycosyltransferase [Glaciihabitans sp.]|nr:glycosyltransferase [Glaciihabitans sp.]
MEAFVRGPHHYFLPTTTERDAFGLGRGGRAWPDQTIEIDPADVADAGIDAVVLQRVDEIPRAERLLRQRLGTDIPAFYVEHNAPRLDIPSTRHPLADSDTVTIVHVSHFNQLMWDCGTARTVVIEHGVPDPGALYTGRLPRMGAVINDPVRRWRVTGTDLLPLFAEVAPVDLFGMGSSGLDERFADDPSYRPPSHPINTHGDLPNTAMHAELAQRRLYIHPLRWTSLGLSLLEAMHLGMPVVALATTEAIRAVPPEAGAISTNVDDLIGAARRLIDDPDEAQHKGQAARAFVREHYGLDNFLAAWTHLLEGASTPTRALLTNAITERAYQ